MIEAHKNGVISGKSGIDPSINPYEYTSYSKYWKAGYVEGFAERNINGNVHRAESEGKN